MSVFRNMLMEITSQPPTPTPSYTPVKYIQSSGTQYINTGYVVKGSKFKVKIKYYHLSGGVSQRASIIGNYSKPSGSYYKTNATIHGGKFYVSNVEPVPNVSYSFDIINEVEIETNSSATLQGYYEIKNNGVLIASGNNAGLFPYSDWVIGSEENYKVMLFTQTSPQFQIDSAKSSAKLYYCQMWDDDVLVRDYIPVLDENNVACLYDKVSETYFYNAGTGIFSYELKTYTITFNSNGGWTEYQPVIVTPGQSIDLSQYTIGEGDPGAEFGGWTSTKNDDATLLPSTFTPTEDITIYAYWQPELSLSPISYNSQANALGFKNIVNLSSALSSSYIDHLDDSGGDSFEIQHNGEQVGGIDIYHDEVVYVDINLNTTGVDGKIDSLSFNYVSNADFTKFTGTGSYFDDELNEYILNMCFNEVDSFDSNYEPLYLNLYNSDTQSEYFTDAMNLVSQLVYYRYDGE